MTEGSTRSGAFIFSGTREEHANLMVGFFGPSFCSPDVTGLGGGGIEAVSSVFGFAAQANEMHRFFSSAWIAGSFSCCVLLAMLPLCTLLVCAGKTVLPLCVTVTRGTKPTSDNRGLGELVRAGVVNPVSQVRSAAEDRLKLLVMDRRLLAFWVEPASSSE